MLLPHRTVPRSLCREQSRSSTNSVSTPRLPAFPSVAQSPRARPCVSTTAEALNGAQLSGLTSPAAAPAAAASTRTSFELFGPNWSNRGRLTQEMLDTLLELPGTKGWQDFQDRTEALTTWKLALQRGTLPKLDTVEWPQEPFKTKFAEALLNLEMPRFTRRYPAVLDTLIKQMLTMVQEFEQKLAEAEANRPPPKQERQQQQQQSNQQQQQQQNPDQQQQQQDSEPGEGQSGGGGAEDMPDDMEMSEEQMQQMMQEALNNAKNQQQNQDKGKGKQLQVKLEGMSGDAGEKQSEEDEQDAAAEKAMQEAVEKAAEEIVKGFENKMVQVMDNLEEAEMAFDDLNSLLEGSEGFDLSRGTWRRSGWRELQNLRKVLEDCPELRDLVRQLGRGGGKGPLRRAPEELEAKGFPPGVIRSPLQPEEVRGLTRSDELSRMLPSEMALMAHGWPRKARSSNRSSEDDDGAESSNSVNGKPSNSSSPTAQLDGSVSSSEFEKDYYLPGARAARMLHRVRRAERMLMSYERTGWLEDEPARITGRMEIRPAAEMGPIILCLDTSGSMHGARETVAKALALECLRGAHRQRRPCYLYAFSGPNDVQELELKVDINSLDKLLEFLDNSFMGGTDVDRPLQLSLDRMEESEWAQADILMVTDGEIPMPSDKVAKTITDYHENRGLEVHGLIVSNTVSDAMRKVCTDIHVFKSWTAVGGQDYMYL